MKQDGVKKTETKKYLCCKQRKTDRHALKHRTGYGRKVKLQTEKNIKKKRMLNISFS